MSHSPVVATMLVKYHDELIARLGDGANAVALTAVIALHTHVTTGKRSKGKSGLSARCTECGFAYPCPTITIIKEVLDGTN